MSNQGGDLFDMAKDGTKSKLIQTSPTDFHCGLSLLKPLLLTIIYLKSPRTPESQGSSPPSPTPPTKTPRSSTAWQMRSPPPRVRFSLLPSSRSQAGTVARRMIIRLHPTADVITKSETKGLESSVVVYDELGSSI